MKILSARFLVSAAAAQQYPPPDVPEIAFVGKSNVGKSSLINTLLNRKNLVKTSSTPGKTRLLNFFLINDAFRFVDLPGYGYAKVSKSEQAGWRKLCERYLKGRENLRGVVMIVDIRHTPGALDAEMREWLAHADVPVLVVASKADKLSRAQIAKHLEEAAEALGEPEPPLAFSAKTHLGRDTLWARLSPWLAR